jgi:diguanylate cyclase (GGDEF)-like protein/PAS domain S-box-containing protein
MSGTHLMLENVKSLLVVEPSATRHHVLRRALHPFGYVLDWVREADAALERVQAGRTPYAALLLGLPEPGAAETPELLDWLRRREFRDLPLLLLAHTACAETLDWVAKREQSALLLWDDHADCANCLERLLRVPAPTNADAHALGNDDIRVLFVDDSRTVRAAYQRLLSENGYAVEVASDAKEGFAKAVNGKFEIAIVDYFMPGENGDVLTRRLREHRTTESMTVAILTGTYLDQVIKDSLHAGAVECMFKNEPEELFLARLSAMSRTIRATKSVEDEHRRLSGILASVGDGVYGVNRRGQITFLNPAARRILKLADRDLVVGRLAHKLFHHTLENNHVNPIDHCRLQQAYAQGTQLQGFETVFWRQDKTPVPVECTAFPLNVEGKLTGAVVAFRDISERRALEQKLLWQANHDSLTQLCNRGCFEKYLEDEVNRLKRSIESCALLYLDLDRFKYINDTAGHAAGDQLLIELSQALQARLREADQLARLGGDEFAMILRNIEPTRVFEVADEFRDVLEHYTFVYGGKRYQVNGSIGVVLLDGSTTTPGDALANADLACHLAKSKGRNQTHVYRAENDTKVSMYQDLGWSTRLQDALQQNGFVLHYQPIVAIAELDVGQLPLSFDGPALRELYAVHGAHFETLVRLRDARGGLIYPNAFLPTAERFSLMPQIDIWTVTRAIQTLAALHHRGQTLSLTVNISGNTLDDQRLVPEIKRLFKETGCPASALIFEITETSAIENIEAAKRLIEELRELGCRFALDDFGSGFSSFYHLKHLPVDFVKIDGQFVKSMAIDPIDRAIVTSINEIAHSFGKRTIAEFVESREILTLLHECGVDYAQGYYLSPPRAELLVDENFVPLKMVK